MRVLVMVIVKNRQIGYLIAVLENTCYYLDLRKYNKILCNCNCIKLQFVFGKYR